MTEQPKHHYPQAISYAKGGAGGAGPAHRRDLAEQLLLLRQEVLFPLHHAASAVAAHRRGKELHTLRQLEQRIDIVGRDDVAARGCASAGSQGFFMARACHLDRLSLRKSLENRSDWLIP